ncbi:MAG: hypothetical protein PVH31_00365 [Ectothiorhodospiraceae bacterium]
MTGRRQETAGRERPAGSSAAGDRDREERARRGVRRTVIILVLVALAIYVGFFLERF